MNEEAKKFFRFIIQGIVILLVVDFTLGKTLSYLHERITTGEKARANYFIKKDTSDVIIFGSSRAVLHYHSGIISDSLHMSVYNAGRFNQTILYHTALLKCIVKRHVPKIIILDVNEDELVQNAAKYEFLSVLLPYYKYDRDIRETYDAVNPAYRYWSWSKTLPYNSILAATVYRGMVKSSEKDQDIHGYLEHQGYYQGALKKMDNCQEKYLLDDKLKKSFQDFITICKMRRIKLFIFTSPRYVHYQCRRVEFDSLKSEANRYGFPLVDFSERMTNKKYFVDPSHLNSGGALRYSEFIVQQIKLRKAV